MRLSKGIRDIFENFEWNFRDIGIQRFMDLGILFAMLCERKFRIRHYLNQLGILSDKTSLQPLRIVKFK